MKLRSIVLMITAASVANWDGHRDIATKINIVSHSLRYAI